MSEGNGQELVIGRKLSEFNDLTENDPNELLKHGFLCREGVLGLYGKTGIGKSSLAMQAMILWALARQAFQIHPTRPLKSLLIQAENDDRDITETRNGIIDGLTLTPDEAKQACDNVIVIHEDSKCGQKFFDDLVKTALEQHKPDLLWIDPILAYLGGDAIAQETVSAFLRNGLKPLLKIHQCAAVILHHMNKTGSTDTAYAGGGSAEFANMPRAILTLAPKGNSFELTAAKRGSRLGWKMPDRTSKTLTKLLKHSDIAGQIFWLEANESECKNATTLDELQTEEEKVLTCIPDNVAINQSILRVTVNEKTGLGANKVQKRIKQMVKEEKLFEIEVSRLNARPEIHISRSPSKAVTGG